MLAIFCLRLAGGMAGALLILSPAQINPRFFRVQFLAALALAATAAFVTWQAVGLLLGLVLGGRAIHRYSTRRTSPVAGGAMGAGVCRSPRVGLDGPPDNQAPLDAIGERHPLRRRHSVFPGRTYEPSAASQHGLSPVTGGSI